ncbi:PfkB family carbohydrate kinase [Caballeronia sp. HLA56]
MRTKSGDARAALAARGIAYGDGTTRIRPAAHAAHAVETSGAGDAFIGAFAAALVAEASLEFAIDRAQRAASISVTRNGAMISIPFMNEVLS